jgi:hypothetical protein
MFFTRVAEIIAWLAFIPFSIMYGIVFAGLVTGNEEWLRQTFGASFALSQGEFLKGIAFGVAFGVAAEISRSVASKE